MKQFVHFILILIAIPALVIANSGDLDLTFDADGKVTTSFGSDAFAVATALQLDGKIIVAGTVGSDIAVVRYNPNGSLDPTFNGTGILIVDFNSGNNDWAEDVAPPIGWQNHCFGHNHVRKRCGRFCDGTLKSQWNVRSNFWFER